MLWPWPGRRWKPRVGRLWSVGNSRDSTQAEYATPSLFYAGPEHPLLDRSLPPETSQPLASPPLVANMPLLSMDALIGRRAVLRRVMQVLRDHPQAVAVHGRKAGVLLWGMGGVGKSALAGRVMARLLEDGWTALAVVGRWSLGELATRVGAQLLGHHNTALDRLGDILLRRSCLTRYDWSNCRSCWPDIVSSWCWITSRIISWWGVVTSSTPPPRVCC